MNQKEIHALLGFSQSTISKILNGQVNGFNKNTISQIKSLSTLKINLFDEILKHKMFLKICETIIRKGSARDDKDFVNISNFACLCKSKHQTLYDPEPAIELEELIGKYYGDSAKLIKNPLFNKMCGLAIKKCVEIRQFAERIMQLSSIMQNINHKVKENDLQES